jgi:hypothetical protein
MEWNNGTRSEEWRLSSIYLVLILQCNIFCFVVNTECVYVLFIEFLACLCCESCYYGNTSRTDWMCHLYHCNKTYSFSHFLNKVFSTPYIVSNCLLFLCLLMNIAWAYKVDHVRLPSFRLSFHHTLRLFF